MQIDTPEIASTDNKILLCCPLCGGNEFTEYDNSGSQVPAIYCNTCPYGVEDSTLTLTELRKWHNTRKNLELNN